MGDKFKNKIFDIDTGELREDKPRKHRRGWGTVPKPKTKKVKARPLSEFPPEKRKVIERMNTPRWGLSVTREWVETHCLKKGNKCKRFHIVGLSEGEQQYVICLWGPKKVCERRKGGREK